MAAPTFGLLCPEGHGVMIDRDDWARAGVAWCSHSEHGGNGRFYRLTEVRTGSFNPHAPRVKSEWQIEQEAKAAALMAAREERKMAEKTPKPKPEPKARAPRKAREPQSCKCGCGEMTKGGMFKPGHDARYHSAVAKAEGAKAVDAADAAQASDEADF